MKKITLKKQTDIFLLSFIFMLSSLFLFGFMFGIKDYDEFSRLESSAVKVTATITSIEVVNDVDDSGYETYITYEYNGTKYTDIKYKKLYTQPSYGEKVTVEIDPQNPARLRPLDSGITQIVMCGLSYIFIAYLLTLTASKKIIYNKEKTDNWKNIYNSEYINVEIIKRDIANFKKNEKNLLLKCSIIIVALLFCVSIVYCFINKTFTAILSIIPIMILYLGLIYITFVRYSKLIGKCWVEKDILIEKKQEYVGVGENTEKTEVWVFKNSGDWIPIEESFVSLKDQTLSDFSLYSEFYLAKELGKGIIRVFDAKEFKLNI